MSVDSKAIIRKGVNIQEIELALKRKYSEVRVISSSMDDIMYVMFKDGQEDRQMAVSFNGSCLKDNGIDGVRLSLGLWGNTIEILKYLCQTFGGYLDENDCDDIGFYSINFELYEKGKDFTEMDKFRNKVISKLGYEKLNIAMQLFEEFKQI